MSIAEQDINMSKDRIIKTLAKGTAEEKSALLEELRENDTRDTGLIHPLVDCLELESSRAVKERIIMILHLLLPLSQFKEVDRMLRSSHPFIRNGAVEIIKQSDIPIIQFLENLAEDDDKDVRKFVIDALSMEKSEQAMEIVRRRLHDEDTNIVYTAIEYLGSFNDAVCVEEIETILLNSDNFMVICAGLEALAKIRKSPNKEKILAKYMNTKQESITTFPLLKYLGTFGDTEAFPYFHHLMESKPGMFTKEILDAVERILQDNEGSQLSAQLRESLETLQLTANSVTKYAIGKLLTSPQGSPGSGESSSQLEKARKMLEDENIMVKLCAAELLAEIGTEEDIERLDAASDVTDSDELLEAIGDAVMKIEERLEA